MKQFNNHTSQYKQLLPLNKCGIKLHQHLSRDTKVTKDTRKQIDKDRQQIQRSKWFWNPEAHTTTIRIRGCY